jgi:uncharacterized protein (TIGR03437 family)
LDPLEMWARKFISAGASGSFDLVSPGTWIEIYGQNLVTDSRQWGGGDFNGVNAPTSSDGTSVTIGSQSAFVYSISPGQVDALAPGALSGAGPQRMIATTPKGISRLSFQTAQLTSSRPEPFPEFLRDRQNQEKQSPPMESDSEASTRTFL